jgi:hypothetical protein
MFLREISLWTGGPVLTLGDYFVGFRYLFCLIFLTWAVSILRWPRRSVVLGGALFLGALGFGALDLPLGRPYGLAENRGGLEELGEPMVAAALGAPTEGALVGRPNAWPFWSLLLSLGSGFDPARLSTLYRFVPVVSLLLLALAVYAALDTVAGGAERERGMAAALGAFFVLFLSVPRLSFLENEPPLWTEIFWLRSRLGVGLALSLLSLQRFARARTAGGFVFGGILLGAAGWMEPHWLLLGGGGIALWSLFEWRRGEPNWSSWIGLSVAVGLALLWPATSFRPPPPAELWTWHAAVGRLFSVSVSQGAVFYLGVFGVLEMIRGRRRESLLFASWTVTAYVLWVVVSFSDGAALLLDRSLVKSFLRVLLAGAAAWGAHRALLWIDEKWKVRGRSTYLVGFAALIGLSLPWVFPFWWSPIRMDPVYVESVEPIPQEYSTFGEWMRTSTPPEAAFVAGRSYASWIPALAGRRVLLRDEKDHEREQALLAIASSNDPQRIRAAALEWSLTHFAWGRLERGGPTVVDFAFLDSSPLFSIVYRQRRWIRVYEIHPERLGGEAPVP